MRFQAEDFASRLELVQNLPPEQFEAARKVIFKGGDVSWYDKTHLGISFHGDQFTDDDLSLLAPFRGSPVASFGFLGVKLSEAAMARGFENFPAIKSIYLHEMPAGDRALAHLDRFHDLEYVEFGGTKITSASLRHMAHQPRLQYLHVSETNIDNAGLKSLEGHQVLKSLFIGNTQITSAGLVSIAKMPNLDTLLLNDTKVEDDGLEHLTSLTKLTTLRLDGSEVTNAGMVHLAQLPKLKSVSVGRTAVNEDGLKLLQNAPQLEEVRWVNLDKATPEQKQFHIRFILYLPAHRDRLKEQREQFERGELKIE